MARKVIVEFNLSEAKALSRAAGQTTDDPDAMEATFSTDVERRAAYRGNKKLDDAIRAVCGWTTPT
jgi:hypothetical protein